MPTRFASATCANCQTEFDGLPVERDEDGAYAVLEVYPCADTRCDTLLCGCCSQFQCDGCGHTFCSFHLVTAQELNCCGPCAAETDQGELELATCCPDCRSENVQHVSFDFGTDSQTGYDDSGEGFRCLDCGAKGETADLIPAEKPARRPITSETATPARVQELA